MPDMLDISSLRGDGPQPDEKPLPELVGSPSPTPAMDEAVLAQLQEMGYKLVAFVSHMGTSSMVGHYVVHILKDGHSVIFNDSKVALSENPPKELGYLYLYERL